MFENTLGAMNQLAEFMIEADQDDVLDISRTELRAMQEMVGYCEQYLRLADEFEVRRQALLAGCSEDEMEEF
jgi:hypothetical protein